MSKNTYKNIYGNIYEGDYEGNYETGCETTNKDKREEYYCLSCGKDLKDDEKLLGFCKQCDEMFRNN